MKYKLINTEIKEEFICEKVEVDGFEYYISDEKVQGGTFKSLKDKFIVFVFDKKDNKIYEIDFRVNFCILDRHFLVIATNNPSLDIPQIVEEMANNNTIKHGFAERVEIPKNAFKNGYNKAKEQYPYNKQDMIEFGKYCNRDAYSANRITTFEKLLKRFELSQPKIIYFK